MLKIIEQKARPITLCIFIFNTKQGDTWPSIKDIDQQKSNKKYDKLKNIIVNDLNNL